MFFWKSTQTSTYKIGDFLRKGGLERSLQSHRFSGFGLFLWIPTQGVEGRISRRCHSVYPPRTNIAPENRWLEDEIPFGTDYFSGAMLVSGSVECRGVRKCGDVMIFVFGGGHLNGLGFQKIEKNRWLFLHRRGDASRCIMQLKI